MDESADMTDLGLPLGEEGVPGLDPRQIGDSTRRPESPEQESAELKQPVGKPTHDWTASSYRPLRWLPGPHLQTLGGKIVRPSADEARCAAVGLQPYRLELPDGDFLDLELATDPAPEAPIVLMLHGLGGSVRKAYMIQAIEELQRNGFFCIGMNFRGCSGVPNRLARFYHAGDSQDLLQVVNFVREHYPNRRLYGLGFSIGGNALLKLFGEMGLDTPFQGGVAISVPYDLAAGSAALSRGAAGKFYTWYFIRSLRRKLLEKREILTDRIELDRALAATTLEEFDDFVTAPLHGFESASHYYASTSSQQFLPDIARPTLLVHALDDPFMPRGTFPFRELEHNPALHAAVVKTGGHVGFLGHGPTRFWAESQAAQFLAHLEAPSRPQ